MTDQTALETVAWLIERRVTPAQWSVEQAPTGVGAFYSDIHRAHRFATKAEAEEAMRQMRITAEERGQYFVSEHMWIATRPAKPALEACPKCGAPCSPQGYDGPSMIGAHYFCSRGIEGLCDQPIFLTAEAWNRSAFPAPEPVAAMEPVAWMYERKPDAWPPARPIVQFNRWDDDDAAREFWTETPIYREPPATDPLMDEVREAGSFLLDRLVDHEVRITSDEDGREFAGHVIPAMVRFRAVLAKLGERK